MDRIVVAIENEGIRKRISDMLEASGILIRGSCRSGAEAIRWIKKMGGGIIICGYKLADMMASDLAVDLNGAAMILVIATPSLLNMCNNESIFKLAAPVSKGDLIASVRMLMQLEEKHIRISPPRRTDKENAEVAQAKELLMSKNGMSEEEAHRYIQRKSMDSGAKAVETARLIIESYGKEV
jgi:AmiR/NasT family two-component response regulator